MPKPSSCIALWLVGCMLITPTSMSAVLLTPDTIAGTIAEVENKAAEDTISTAYPEDEVPLTEHANCTFQELLPEDVTLIGTQGKLLIMSSSTNLTLTLSQSDVFDPAQNVCYKRGELVNKQILELCRKGEYNGTDFSIKDDGTVWLSEQVLEPGSYSIQDGVLKTCAVEDANSTVGHSNTQSSALYDIAVYIGQVCYVISIFALAAHLVSFCLVPSVRTLPGYHLASLSAALLLGYLFSLLGQIPQVLGFFCVVCGTLLHYFFLAAFFCMNSLAFDVWRSFKMATTQLVMTSQKAKRRQFLYYSIYFWGVPFVLMATCLILDNIPATPDWFRPGIGKNDFCWMVNLKPKLVFFMGPAFVLFLVNALFFVLSAFTIKSNTMDSTSDEQRQTARHNYTLYLRLGIIMGVAWVTPIIAAFVGNTILWIVVDFFTSLQGLYVFLLFTCSKKVVDRVRDKVQLAVTLKTPKTSTTDLTSRKTSDTTCKSFNINQ